MVHKTGGVLFLIVLLVGLGCLLMTWRPATQAEPTPPQKGETQFAADRSPVPFDGNKAMEHLETICKIGPRVSGSEGMKKQQELLKKHFEDLGGKVELQKFTARQTSRKAAVDMANMIVRWNPDLKRRVIVCCHYDTRPYADQEEDRRKWSQPFVSANDGGSGVALMMELGRHMKDFKTAVGVDFVFFDGEEYIFDRDADKYFFGSEYFADAWKKSKNGPTYLAAILLDMMGGKNAIFQAEANSLFLAGKLVEEFWKVAAEIKAPAFIGEIGPRVEDDHLALNKVGIPAIDVIDFSYPHWHRITDTPDQCSADTLDQVARVLCVWMQRVR